MNDTPASWWASRGERSAISRRNGTTKISLTKAIVALASEYGRYGYRRITALLRQAGWNVGKDRVQRIWRREGLKVPAKQKPRRRLWLNDGSCIRLRPERPNHVWSYDFVEACTHDGRSLRLLTMIDEYTRQCVAIRVSFAIDAKKEQLSTRHVPRSRTIPCAKQLACESALQVIPQPRSRAYHSYAKYLISSTSLPASL